jgi:hypothetical protein
VYETLEEAATEMRDDPVAGPFVAGQQARLRVPCPAPRRGLHLAGRLRGAPLHAVPR